LLVGDVQFWHEQSGIPMCVFIFRECSFCRRSMTFAGVGGCRRRNHCWSMGGERKMCQIRMRCASKSRLEQSSFWGAEQPVKGILRMEVSHVTGTEVTSVARYL